MTKPPDPVSIPEWAGLCASCGHARPVVSGRGSVFVLCERSHTDPRYRRYPMLPVLRCDGYPAAGRSA